jgi:hypothetical protein
MAKTRKAKSEESHEPGRRQDRGPNRDSGREAGRDAGDAADRRRALRRGAAHGVVALMLLGICTAGLYYAKAYVDEAVAPPLRPPTVVFTHRPAWMSDLLARKLAASLTPRAGSSVFDRGSLVSAAVKLRANPWVAELRQVRRVYGKGPGDTIEVDCDFRSPLALVKSGNDYWFVDGHGVKLPEKFAEAELPAVVFSADGTTNLRVIEGVRHLPPRDAGQVWPGEDLAAGLEMAAHLYGQSFAQEVVKIDVANFGGRVAPREAQVVLITRYNTEVRWGRPWGATDAFVEVPPERKVQYLRRVLAEYGRVDAHQAWIDIRFDKITYPDPSEAVGVEANDTR